MKEKHCCINPKNLNDNKCFQYAVVAALYHPEIANHPERIGYLEPFINRYNWTGITYLTQSNQWSKFEKQNPTIALNMLEIEGEKRVRQAFISKYNSTREKHVDLLIVHKIYKIHVEACKDHDYCHVKMPIEK